MGGSITAVGDSKWLSMLGRWVVGADQTIAALAISASNKYEPRSWFDPM